MKWFVDFLARPDINQAAAFAILWLGCWFFISMAFHIESAVTVMLMVESHICHASESLCPIGRQANGSIHRQTRRHRQRHSINDRVMTHNQIIYCEVCCLIAAVNGSLPWLPRDFMILFSYLYWTKMVCHKMVIVESNKNVTLNTLHNLSSRSD